MQMENFYVLNYYIGVLLAKSCDDSDILASIGILLLLLLLMVIVYKRTFTFPRNSLTVFVLMVQIDLLKRVTKSQQNRDYS